jgi:hypothetical protein
MKYTLWKIKCLENKKKTLSLSSLSKLRNQTLHFHRKLIHQRRTLPENEVCCRVKYFVDE